VGYKKHTLRLIFRLHGKWRNAPMITQTEPANLSDGGRLKPLLEEARSRLNFLPEIVVADMGYLDQEIKAELRNQYRVAVVTRAKSNMLVPPGCEEDGCPSCPQGQRLIWERYLRHEKSHRYHAPSHGDICMICPDQNQCPQEFRFSPDDHETFLGMIPLHSRLAKQLLARIRPLVEAGFEADKNRFNLSGFFINRLELARTLSYLADACNILTLTAELRSHHGRRCKEVDRQSRRQLELPFGPPKRR
jgi:hypothetical protein